MKKTQGSLCSILCTCKKAQIHQKGCGSADYTYPCRRHLRINQKKSNNKPPDTLISQDFTSTVFSNNDLNTEMCLSGFLRHRYLPHLNEKNLLVELLHIFNTYLGSQGILPQNSNDIPDLLEMLGIICHFRSTLQTLSVNKIQTLFCWAGGSVSF